MRTFFELAWPQHYAGRGEEWFRLGRDDDGQWWYDGWLIGRVPIGGGAEHVAAFARFLLAERPEHLYEDGFLLLRHDRPAPGFWDPAMLMNVTVLLNRERTGDPESLVLVPDGWFPETGIGAHVCDPLEYEPMDRDRVRAQAAALLDAAANPAS